MRQGCEQAVGARQEYYIVCKNLMMQPGAIYPVFHTTPENVQLTYAITSAEWGEDFTALVESMRSQKFLRHHPIARKSPYTYK